MTRHVRAFWVMHRPAFFMQLTSMSWLKDNTSTSTSPVSGSRPLWTRLQTRSDGPLATDSVLVFVLGAASGAGAILAWRRWGMRLRTAEWVTPNELARRRWVRGVVTR